MIPANLIRSGVIVKHEPSNINYVIKAVGVMRTPSGWVDAARYNRVHDPEGHDEFYRAVDEFEHFTLVS